MKTITVVAHLVGDMKDGAEHTVVVDMKDSVPEEPPENIYVSPFASEGVVSPLTQKAVLVYRLLTFKSTSRGGRYIYEFVERRNWTK